MIKHSIAAGLGLAALILATVQIAVTQEAQPGRKMAVFESPDDIGREVAKNYPPQSRRKGEQGTVGISACIEANGRVTEIAVAQSSGFERLDKATAKILGKQKAKPATDADGAPIRSCGWEADLVWILIRG